jgi:hypothetical protein
LTYPPQPPDPNRPQDTPRNFPTYARPDQPPQQPPGQAQQPQQQPWQAPQQPPRQESPYGRSETRYDGPQGQPGAPQPGSPYSGAPQSPFAPPYQVPPQGPQYPGQGYPPAYGQQPPPYGYGYGYPGASQYKTNGLAIAALATGLGSIVFAIAAPVAIGLGIAALVQIKRRREGGTAQAVVGLVAGSAVSVLWLILLVAVIGAGVADDPYGADTPISTPTFRPGVYIDELEIGECYDETGADDEVERTQCISAHEAELFAVVTLAAKPWPGEQQIRKESQAACDKAFLPYVGIAADESELESVVWYPELSAWSSGDHQTYCTAYGPSGDDLTGSVKGTKR